MEITSLAILLSWLIFPFGQLLKIRIANVEIPILDLSLLLIAFISLKKTKLNIYWKLFLVISLLSFVWGCWQFGIAIKPFFYYLRLLSFVILLNSNFVKKTKITYISLVSFLVFGIIQYLFWPDLTYFSAVNRDPHLNRLVSSLLDPTYTALIYLLFFIHLYFQKRPNPVLLGITYLAIALTYSRSTLLAFLVVSFFYSVSIKKIQVFMVSLALVGLTYFMLPKPPGEGTNLNRTASLKAKVVNYQEAFMQISQNPVFGVGYNFLGKVRTINNPQSLSVWGFDNSLLTIAATTGLTGLMFFILGLYTFIAKLSLSKKLLWLAVLIHSFFANSLLYPWIYWILINFSSD